MFLVTRFFKKRPSIKKGPRHIVNTRAGRGLESQSVGNSQVFSSSVIHKTRAWSHRQPGCNSDICSPPLPLLPLPLHPFSSSRPSSLSSTPSFLPSHLPLFPPPSSLSPSFLPLPPPSSLPSPLPPSSVLTAAMSEGEIFASKLLWRRLEILGRLQLPR